MPEVVRDFYNFLTIKLVFFVVFAAKVMDMFVFPCYQYSGSGVYFKISTHKTKMYPLYFDSRWGFDTIKKSLKFLFSDLLKLMKMMGVDYDTHVVFEKYQDFFDILWIVQNHLFGEAEER